MSLDELTKEQKQYLVFGGVAMLLLALLIWWASAILSSIQAAKEELDDLSMKLESAKRAMADRSKASSDILNTVAILSGHFENAPPERNYYSWASEVVYSKAREVELEVDSIDEVGGGNKKASLDDDDSIRMGSYALRIAAHGGYDNIRTFIQQLKRQHPLVRFTGLEISAGSAPDVHDVHIWMQWPSNLASLAAKWESLDTDLIARKKQESKQNMVADASPAEPEKSRKQPTVSSVAHKGSLAEAKEASQKPLPSTPKIQVAAKLEHAAPKQKVEAKPTAGQSKVGAALAKISAPPAEVESRPSQEPDLSVEPEMVDTQPTSETKKPKSNQSDLDAVLATIIVDSFEAASSDADVEPESMIEDIEGIDDMDLSAVATEKSALKLEKLLIEKASLPSGATLNTLLGNLLEDSDGN